MTTGNLIPITYFVSAQAVTPQQGLEPLKISTILLLTDETPAKSISTPYLIARTAATVANTWGTLTETAKQANIVFSQQPNILVNNGYLIVAPYLNTTKPATAGSLTTPVVTANIENFASISNGALTITIDGTQHALTDLDFEDATTLDDIAAVIQNELTDAAVSAETGTIVFTSNTTGATSSVVISETTGTGKTDLYGADYLDIANAVEVEGQDATTSQETMADAIVRLKGLIYFEGILTTRNVSDEEFLTASNAVQALDNRIMPLPRSLASSLDGIFQKTKANTNTKNMYYGLGDSADDAAVNARLFAAAYLSRGFAVNYSGSDTTLTMNLKTLTGIAADTTIDETLLSQIEAAGADCYASVEGLAKVVSYPQNGQYFDQIANRIWFVNAIQRAVFGTIATVGTKIAQTEEGLRTIADTIKKICKQAVTNGYIAPGTWNSADTFGKYDDFMRNIREYGYYQYHQPVSEQEQSERQQRKMPFWQVAAKEAGAVHSANILIYIEA